MSRKIDRREFLRSSLVTTATLAATGTISLLDSSILHAAYPDVVVVYGRDPGQISRKAVESLGGMQRFVKPGNKVVIKPNMSFASGPDAGSNTHPAVVREVAKMCAEAGASKISVLDNVLHNASDCLSMSRIPEVCKDVPHTSVSAAQAKRLFREVKVANGQQFKSMEVLAEVTDADVLIAVPVGKSHSSSGVSLSMKGMMGLINDRISFHSRYDLHQAIVDMVSVIKPQLVVVDGTRILSSGGPGGPGKIIPLNLVVASTDMVAADAQMIALGTWYDRKFRPDQVRHVRLAAERGLGSMDLQKLNVQNINM
jgi:uncharacterized protein (DUF362 family)